MIGARTFKIGDDLTENELSKVGGLGLFCGSRISLKITQLNIFHYHFGPPARRCPTWTGGRTLPGRPCGKAAGGVRARGFWTGHGRMQADWFPAGAKFLGINSILVPNKDFKKSFSVPKHRVTQL